MKKSVGITSKQRSTNIEILRLLAMVGVVVLHINNASIGKAFVFTPLHSNKWYMIMYLESFFICAVDVFILISGYFLSEKKQASVKKPLRLIIQLICFRITVKLIRILLHKDTFVLSTFWEMLIPTSYFLILYAVVYCLSPYINKLLSVLSQTSIRKLIVLCFVLFSILPYMVDIMNTMCDKNYNSASTIGNSGSQSGYTCVNFVLMYLIGACIKKTGTDIRKRFSGPLFILCTFLIFVMAILLERNGLNCWLAWEYCNPMVIASSVFAFLFFRRLKVKNIWIVNSLAKASISVYFLNTTFLTWFDICKYSQGNGYLMIGYFVFTSFCICLLSWVAECLFGLVAKPLFSYMDKHHKDWIIRVD